MSIADPHATPWRQQYPPHPCADVYPMLPDQELAKLADDIKANGLQQPIALWRDPTDGNTTVYTLDGRNRFEALTRAGQPIPEPGSSSLRFVATDPAAYVISANIHRRHLTKEQQAELIVRTIDAVKNDRATVARSFNPEGGKKGGSTKDPGLAAAVTEGQKHGISKRTIQTARAKVHGKAPAPRKTLDVATKAGGKKAPEARARQDHRTTKPAPTTSSPPKTSKTRNEDKHAAGVLDEIAQIKSANLSDPGKFGRALIVLGKTYIKAAQAGRER
jgi:hypothetical protein